MRNFCSIPKTSLGEIVPEVKDCEKVVQVIHVPSARSGQFLQVYLDLHNQKGVGFFGPKQEKNGSDQFYGGR